MLEKKKNNYNRTDDFIINYFRNTRGVYEKDFFNFDFIFLCFV